MSRTSVLAGIRRLLMTFAVVVGVTAALSLLIGVAAGSTVSRSIATGFYLVGVVFLVFGVMAGIRGPLRAKHTEERTPALSIFGLGVGGRGVRAATGEEQHDAAAVAVLLLGLGVVLIVIAVGADSNTHLVGR